MISWLRLANVNTFYSGERGNLLYFVSLVSRELSVFPCYLPTMLRTQLARSAARAGTHSRPLVARSFASTPLRQAEVELTIGMVLARYIIALD